MAAHDPASLLPEAPLTPWERWSSQHPALLALGVFVAYLLGAELGQWLSAEPGPFATFWPNTGLVVAVLLRTPTPRWWVVIAAASVANIVTDVQHDQLPFTAVGFAVANAVSSISSALLVRRWLGPTVPLDTLQRVLGLFALTTLVGTPIGATIGASIAAAAHDDPLAQTWRLWWMSDALGVLVTAPVVLDLLGRRHLPRLRRLGEAALLMVALVVSGELLYRFSPTNVHSVLNLFLLTAAIRHGLPGVAATTLVHTIVTLRHTLHGDGVFAGIAAPLDRVVAVQFFIATSALLFFGLAAVLDERRRARANLERQVRERTATLAEQSERLRTTLASIGDAVVTTDAAGRVTDLNPSAELLAGWRRDEAVGKAVDTIVRIVEVRTRQPVEHPAMRVARNGSATPLTPDTLLLDRTGTARPIEGSAALIRSRTGDVAGTVPDLP